MACSRPGVEISYPEYHMLPRRLSAALNLLAQGWASLFWRCRSLQVARQGGRHAAALTPCPALPTRRARGRSAVFRREGARGSRLRRGPHRGVSIVRQKFDAHPSHFHRWLRLEFAATAVIVWPGLRTCPAASRLNAKATVARDVLGNRPIRAPALSSEDRHAQPRWARRFSSASHSGEIGSSSNPCGNGGRAGSPSATNTAGCW